MVGKCISNFSVFTDGPVNGCGSIIIQKNVDQSELAAWSAEADALSARVCLDSAVKLITLDFHKLEDVGVEFFAI